MMHRLTIGIAALAIAGCTAPIGEAETAPPPAPPATAAEPDSAPADETPAAGAPTMPIPSHIVMRCGGEQLRVRLGDDTAYVVTEDDGSETALPMLEPAADADGTSTTYTNGRMTLERTTAPTHGFRFARGRMAMQTCILAQN